ncbi:hypothetical protein [Devosia aurantiaca]|uniref:Uncharacterized protein n=1 Tax=Devosia aurantiaca TaxID=2714858 RepID=A0A6M1SQA3_9HYPH|nr:hypothetical protein [Devosia aurantiaca]NGP19320.1 hypothetical protein [Devosia aurantiaca]
MTLSMPKTRQLHSKQEAVKAQLKKFLRTKGCTTKTKRQAAVEKASVKL